jgi:hypothetical protein
VVKRNLRRLGVVAAALALTATTFVVTSPAASASSASCAPGGTTHSATTNNNQPTYEKVPGTSVYGMVMWPITFFTGGEYIRDGKSILVMQTDSNFVLYNTSCHATWSSGTYGDGYGTAGFDQYTNLFVGGPGTHYIWKCGSCNANFVVLDVQSDGNVVVYDTKNASKWTVLWATHTNY